MARTSPITHAHLWTLCRRLPGDYAPYGAADRNAAARADRGDCSAGCRWSAPLAGKRGLDWGVCCSPTGYRRGLLTFEHQGGATCFERREGG